jgi:hypothetical protein
VGAHQPGVAKWEAVDESGLEAGCGRDPRFNDDSASGAYYGAYVAVTPLF